MNITPYSISESTKISEAYNNVQQNAVDRVSIPSKSTYDVEIPRMFPKVIQRDPMFPDNPIETNKPGQTYISAAPPPRRREFIGPRNNRNPDWVAGRIGDGVYDGLAIAATGGGLVKAGGTAAKLLPYLINGANIYGNWEFFKDIYNEHPYVPLTAGAIALINPRQSYKYMKKVVNSPWGTAVPVGYYVGKGFYDGYNDAKNSQQPPSDNQPPPSANQPPSPSDNQQTTANVNQQQTTDQQSTTTDDFEAANLAYWNDVVRTANRTGWPISNDGTNNVADKVGVKWLKSQDYKERFTDLWNVVNGKNTRDMEKESNSGK
jgi:hypothetical protein